MKHPFEDISAFFEIIGSLAVNTSLSVFGSKNMSLNTVLMISTRNIWDVETE